MSDSQDCTLDWFFHQAWRWSVGMPEETPRPLRPSLEQLQASQWNPDFERYMRNRLVMGAFRYGMFSEQEKVRHDSTKSIQSHLDAYCVSGNGEHLVDIANLSLVEYTCPSHPAFHFEAIDDGNHHARRIACE